MIVEDRNEERVKPNVDSDGRWIKKGGRFRFGFKQHTDVDENGLVVSVVTTAANESDTKYLNKVMENINLPLKVLCRGRIDFNIEQFTKGDSQKA